MKDVGALLAYPTHGLSHSLDQDKQLDSPRRVILYKLFTRILRTGYNTPKVDVPVAISSSLGICEIRASKITFVNVIFR